ncbi:MAG: phage replisome organizer N-terminal domain-containing protein [Clostridia bacterium]|nr:phage replisome organizer N-terminal domain-containing protein [Clostridia bacterium]
MATGKRYYWIKLKESFMSSDTVDYRMSQPNGANYVVLYQMLCLKTINTDGKLSRQIGEILIPYDVEKIQRDCKWFSVDTIRVALNLYRSFGLIYEDQDGVLVLSDHQNLVGSETDWAAKRRRQRLEQGDIPQLPVDTGGDNVPTDVPTENRDKILDIRDTDIRDEEREIEGEDIGIPPAAVSPPPPRTSPCPFKKIMELYHQICVSYPRIEDIDGERKKAVAARWRKYGDIAVFERVFRIAQASSFMKGENGRNWSADFDWMMKPTNMSKILEHKYDDKPTAQTGQPTGALGVLAKMREECDE